MTGIDSVFLGILWVIMSRIYLLDLSLYEVI
jgi:hypothetical protein